MTAITQATVEPDQTGRSLTTAAFAPARPILVVLGMHRSGTSLCSHILSVLGVDMTDEVVVDPANEKGYWERKEIVAFHDRILDLFGRGYYTPQHDLPLPPGWWADPRLRQLQREAVQCLERGMAREALFGFKDPRTARLLPIWHQVFDELNLVPKIVLCLRNPAQVARSLHDRDGLDLEIGEFRWFSYMVDIFRNVHDQQICTIEYDTWFDNPELNLEKLMRFLDIRWRQSDADLRMAVADIVDHRLRHDRVPDLGARHPLVRSFYELTRGVADDPAARERVDYIVSQVVTYQQLHRPLQREFDRASAQQEAIAAERVAAAAALRDELAARDAALAEADRRAEVVSARVREVLAERGETDAALARAQQEAALQNAAAQAAQQELVAVRAELAVRDAALAEANHRAAEVAASLVAAMAELDAVRAAAAENESAAGLRDELAARDAALAEADRRAEVVSARVREVLAERGEADAALARVQQQAALQNAAAEVAQQELVAARAELAARDAALADANHRAEEVAASLAAAMAELDTARAAAAENESAAALRDELAARDGALAEAGRRAEVISARVREVLAERDQADAALAQAQQEAALQSAAAETAQQELAAARAELAARDAALAEANHRAEEIAASLAAAQARAEEREAALARANHRAEEIAASLAAAQARAEEREAVLARAEAISAERVAEAAALRAERAALPPRSSTRRRQPVG